jgi:hypothetical protein
MRIRSRHRPASDTRDAKAKPHADIPPSHPPERQRPSRMWSLLLPYWGSPERKDR